MTEQQFEGRSAAEAAIKACEAFGTTRAALKYRVVSETGEHLERQVIIAVQASAPVPSEPHEAQADSSTSGDDDGSRRGDESGRGERGRRGSAGRSGGGNRRGGRGGAAAQGRREPREPREGRRPAGRSRAPQAAEDGIEALLKLDAAQVDAPPRRQEVDASSARAQRALSVVGDLLRLLSMNLKATLVGDDDAEMHIDLFGVDEEKMIGRKGEVLLALQFILNRILHREADESDQVVVLDAGGYREKRRASLVQLAHRLAERAVEQGKAVRLSPMSAHDRRVFHLTLQEIDGVVTRSEGEGLLRNLLIIPSEFAQNLQLPAS